MLALRPTGAVVVVVAVRVRVMVLNVTLNDISVISWKPVLLVEKTGVPGEDHRPVAIH
jgi:hypothetical protein